MNFSEEDEKEILRIYLLNKKVQYRSKLFFPL